MNGFDPEDIPLEQRILYPILEHQATVRGDQAFLTVNARTWTFGEIRDGAHAVSQGLWAAGIRRGDFVAIMLPNCQEIVASWFGCALIGAVNVPLNPALRGRLLEKPLDDSKATGLIIHKEFLPALQTLDAEVRGRFKWIAVVGGIDKVELPEVQARTMPFEQLLSGGAGALFEAEFTDVQTVYYTSGTTGPAKGVQTSNAQTFSAASGMIRSVALTAADVVYTPYPLFHGFAARLGVLPALMAGARVFVAERFSASKYWQQASECEATVGHILPGATRILAEQPESGWDRSHKVRAMFNTRSDKSFEERFGVTLVEGFSMTETGFVLYNRWPDRRNGSLGRPHEDWIVELVDDMDLPVAAGKAGALVVRPKLPYIMMRGYLNQPEATVKAFRNLWFHTGDIMRRDEDGYYYFVDRAKERIRRRGENISSYDIEQAALQYASVKECVALPFPTGDGQDDVRLVAVLQPGASIQAAELIHWLSSQLPKSMVPRYVEFRPELPKTATNKVEKVKLITEGLGADYWDGENMKVAQA